MSTTAVWMTFANRPYSPDVIELIHAWDIDGATENPSGYDDTKQEAIAAMGSDILRWVTVEVNVPDAPIRDALAGSVPSLDASAPVVTDAGSPTTT